MCLLGFLDLELELELIRTRLVQKPLLWVEVGESAYVLVGIYDQSLSLFARYDPQCPSLLDFLSGCLVRVLWIVGFRQINRHGHWGKITRVLAKRIWHFLPVFKRCHS
jgi:hypothetical protein